MSLSGGPSTNAEESSYERDPWININKDGQFICPICGEKMQMANVHRTVCKKIKVGDEVRYERTPEIRVENWIYCGDCEDEPDCYGPPLILI